MATAPFEVVSEIEPATKPDLTRVRHQVGVLAPVGDAFLIPDNHLGRATVSSLAVAHEVASMGVQAIACLNSRDRNRLGFRRDLLTAAAYGVDRFLCVFGDQPASGGRANDLNVRAMLEEIRTFGGSETFSGHGPFRVGVTTRLAPLPDWKREADFLFVQASFDLEGLLRWRESLSFDGKIFAGVLVVASQGMAKTLAEATGQIELPTTLLDELAGDPDAGVDRSCSLMAEIKESGAFDGVHLIPVGRYRSVAARLEHDGWRRNAQLGQFP
jgi:methylenetetrahydrofolate reductase (NADPH)